MQTIKGTDVKLDMFTLVQIIKFKKGFVCFLTILTGHHQPCVIIWLK